MPSVCASGKFLARQDMMIRRKRSSVSLLSMYILGWERAHKRNLSNQGKYMVLGLSAIEFYSVDPIVDRQTGYAYGGSQRDGPMTQRRTADSRVAGNSHVRRIRGGPNGSSDPHGRGNSDHGMSRVTGNILHSAGARILVLYKES